MDGIGEAVGRGLQNLSGGLGDVGGSVVRLMGDALGTFDASLHMVFPWFIPTWLVLGALLFIGGLFVFRR
jgi:hypothetical protein